jgi:hypothetical protein
LAANTPRLSDCRGRVDIDKDRVLDVDQIGADSLILLIIGCLSGEGDKLGAIKCS